MTTQDSLTPDSPRPTTPPQAAMPGLGELQDPRLDTLERLAREHIRHQNSDRRWRHGIRLGWLLLAALVLWQMFSHSRSTATATGEHTALVDVIGDIAQGSPSSAESLMPALRSAFEDANAKAVVLRINSPGGSPVQAGLVHDEIQRLKALHSKKVYAVVEEVCASGAYYIAAAADEIYVDKASIVGSIGVLMDGFGFTGLMDKVGVERRLITAGENKGMLDPFSPLSPRQKAYAQQMINQVHQQFITVVRQGRGKRLKETPETFSGLFWNGDEAVRQGLADKLGSLDQVARDVVKAETVVDYTQRDNVVERLSKRLGTSMGEGAMRAVRQLAAPLR